MQKLGENNRVVSLRMENVACVCVSSVFVVGLCVGNDAIYLNTCSDLHEPSFLKALEGERSVIHIKIVPFALCVMMFVTI